MSAEQATRPDTQIDPSTGAAAPDARASAPSPWWEPCFGWAPRLVAWCKQNPIVAVIVGLLSAAHLWDLQYGFLHPWDECTYALRAKFALEGNWLDQMPYCYGYDLTSGFYSGAFPPLLIWAIAISIGIFGETTWAIRLPAALTGVATIILIFKWAREEWNNTVGLWAAFWIAACFYFVDYARRAQFDLPVTFCILLTCYLGLWYYKTDNKKYLIWAGVVMGLGLMTKILVAGFAAVTLLLFAMALWSRGDLKLFRVFKDQVVLNVIGIGIMIPWHLYMTLRYNRPEMKEQFDLPVFREVDGIKPINWHDFGPLGPLFDWLNISDNAFVGYWLGYHVLRRTSVLEEGEARPWFYYFRVMWERFQPLWSALVIAAGIVATIVVAVWLWRGIRLRWFNGETDPVKRVWTDGHKLLLPTCWLLFVYLLSAKSAFKNKTYLIPMLPAMAMLIGWTLHTAWTRFRHHWAGIPVLFVAAFFFILNRDPEVEDHMHAVLFNTRAMFEGMSFGGRYAWLFGEIWPFVLGALALTAVVEGARLFCLHKWQRSLPLTMALGLGVIVVFGAYRGLKNNFTREGYWEVTYWDGVWQPIFERDFEALRYYGNPDQPDHYYYTDAIPHGWREPEVDGEIVSPLKIPEDAPPLEVDRPTLVVIQRAWLRDWTEERVAKYFVNFNEIHDDGEHFILLRSKNRAE